MEGRQGQVRAARLHFALPGVRQQNLPFKKKIGSDGNVTDKGKKTPFQDNPKTIPHLFVMKTGSTVAGTGSQRITKNQSKIRRTTSMHQELTTRILPSGKIPQPVPMMERQLLRYGHMKLCTPALEIIETPGRDGKRHFSMLFSLFRGRSVTRRPQ